ncbi:hypothetical protein AAF712_014974 [Marasmius tenuissimus]|uniref:N-acetyltransferase domain-containing protein n=1 Tax=Marasmius tenuissimus TaxID=585030 RepID=A0ABR2ZAQ2_9AGAR
MLPVTSSFSTTVYFKPSQGPNDIWDALKAHEVDANCVLPVMIEELPNMIKELALEHSGAVPRGASQFWIVMAEKLLDASSLERVFSVFAPDDIASIFAQKWSRLTGVNILPEPYYAAKLSYCTKDTFNRRSLTQNPAWDLRPARDEDLPPVAELCRQFAATCEPFILDEEGAYREAQYLIQSTQVWVHTVSTTHYTDITSIVAFTRNSENNATITKVFTNPEWRGYKCAQRLVARVCRELLFHQGKKSVAIFVAHDNGAASKVYHNVGFGGLYPSSHGLSSAPGWTELDFDPAKVQLGHWSR